MVKDPVCGMDVDETKTTETSEYKGSTYVFCSASCQAKFENNPGAFVKASD